MSLRIAVDVRPLCVPTFGIGRYTGSILEELIDRVDLDIDWFLYADRPLLVDFTKYDNVSVRCFRQANHLFSLYRTQFVYAAWARTDHIDVFWSPRHHLPLTLPRHIRKVVTIHDLVWLYYPETMLTANRCIERLLMPPSIRVADQIICVSTSTEQDLLTEFPAAEGRTHVIHEAASSPPPKNDMIKSDRPYILFVGTLEPRKNLTTLLRAWSALAGQVPHRLVIVGAEGWRENIQQRHMDAGLDDQVEILGHVDDKELHGWYRHATALILPSLYEGFGLPALEAMQYGVPVIGSNVSSIPEVVGPGGLLVNPKSGEDLAVAIQRLIEDDVLREQLSRHARTQAAKFSWQEAARRTLEVLVS